MAALDFPLNPQVNDTYTANGKTWKYNGTSWINNSAGFTGSVGFTGSQGNIGFTGSRGTTGFTGSAGFTGSRGDTGFTGSIGFTGSAATTLNATDDTSTATLYPVMVGAAGSAQTPKVTTTKLTFNASTGELSSTIFNSTSDISQKTNIELIANSLWLINQLHGVTFNWVDTNQASVGLIAQDVEKVIPQLVSTNNNIKQLNYNGVIGILVEAIKELQSKVDLLEKKLDE